MSEGLEERVARLEAALARQALLGRLRLAATLIVLLGVAVYVYGLYSSADEWAARVAEPPRVGFESPTQLRVDVYVDIYNPGDDVLARLVYYRVYINGEYVGDGLVPYLELPSGWSTHRFTVTIDLARAGCGVAEAVAEGAPLRVDVEGMAMVDLRAFGLFTWRTVTLTFNRTAAEVALPEAPEEARALAGIYALLCREAPSLLELIESFGLPSLPLGQTEALKVFPDSYADADTDEFYVIVQNTGGAAASIYLIEVSSWPAVVSGVDEDLDGDVDRVVFGPVVVEPGEKLALILRVPGLDVASGVAYTITIYTEAGNVYTGVVYGK